MRAPIPTGKTGLIVSAVVLVLAVGLVCYVLAIVRPAPANSPEPSVVTSTPSVAPS